MKRTTSAAVAKGARAGIGAKIAANIAEIRAQLGLPARSPRAAPPQPGVKAARTSK